MLVIVGAVIVFLSVFGSFAVHGGNLGVLYQPSELAIIFGAAGGSLLISSPITLLKDVMRQVVASIKGKQTSKAEYSELLLLLYEITKTAKGNLLALEAHVENPEGSEIFKKYPGILHNHHAIHFICDTMKVQISSPMSPYDLEELMDVDLEANHHEEMKAPETVGRIGDAMPGLGIVAAVLGVVMTMGKLAEGKEAIGHSVAAALVGTFLGILASYGFVGPLAAKMKEIVENGGIYLKVIKVALLAFAKDTSPKVCVEFARRSIPEEFRPSFAEIDQATSNIKK